MQKLRALESLLRRVLFRVSEAPGVDADEVDGIAIFISQLIHLLSCRTATWSEVRVEVKDRWLPICKDLRQLLFPIFKLNLEVGSRLAYQSCRH